MPAWCGGRSSSLFLSYGLQGLSSGQQHWKEVSLPIEPSPHPRGYLFNPKDIDCVTGIESTQMCSIFMVQSMSG